MEAKIDLDRLSAGQITDLVEQGVFSQDALFDIARKYKENRTVCYAVLQKAYWVVLLRELAKNPDPEISAQAKQRNEAYNHPA